MVWLKGKIARFLAVSFLGLAFSMIVIAALAIYMLLNISDDFSTALTRTNLAMLGAQIHAESMYLTSLTQRYTSPSIHAEIREEIRDELYKRRIRVDELITQAVDQTSPGDLAERTQLAHIQESVVNLFCRQIGYYRRLMLKGIPALIQQMKADALWVGAELG